jgi:[acyl-carrier-protein] S-malonyltransferase
MGRDLAEAFPLARRTFAEADDRLGFPLSRLCFEGPEERLRLTEHAQPAILTASVAAYRVLEGHGLPPPAAVAGHSLGEWSALVVAEVLDFGDAVAGVRERGRLMQAAVPPGEGAMAAVMGVQADALDALCVEAADGDVCAPANLNGAGQVVVAGHARAIDRLVGLVARQRGRAQILPVSAPFHCALMAPAATGLERWLSDVVLRPPRLPVWTSVEARPVRDANDVRSLLVRQLTGPVRWEETVRGLAGLATLALEVGPGRVLTGLLRRVAPSVEGLPAGDAEGLARARQRWA